MPSEHATSSHLESGVKHCSKCQQTVICKWGMYEISNAIRGTEEATDNCLCIHIVDHLTKFRLEIASNSFGTRTYREVVQHGGEEHIVAVEEYATHRQLGRNGVHLSARCKIPHLHYTHQKTHVCE